MSSVEVSISSFASKVDVAVSPDGYVVVTRLPSWSYANDVVASFQSVSPVISPAPSYA